jgi:hypothetical protein
MSLQLSQRNTDPSDVVTPWDLVKKNSASAFHAIAQAAAIWSRLTKEY